MATNGLQLAIYTSAGSKVGVYGKNQNNQRSEWHGIADKNGVAVTHNWWWKGPVEIIAGHRRKTVNVPSLAIYDTYSVDMSLINLPVHVNL